jgi:hypothetical protein
MSYNTFQLIITNGLAQGFSKNSPLITKEPMFGILLTDPTVTR